MKKDGREGRAWRARHGRFWWLSAYRPCSKIVTAANTGQILLFCSPIQGPSFFYNFFFYLINIWHLPSTRRAGRENWRLINACFSRQLLVITGGKQRRLSVLLRFINDQGFLPANARLFPGKGICISSNGYLPACISHKAGMFDVGGQIPRQLSITWRSFFMQDNVNSLRF